MKFALVDGGRQEAQPTLAGICPCCNGQVHAKCGEVRVWHWAHKGQRNCDPWWESETEWHRTWKNHFPTKWQEVMHHAENGERHIADVKTPTGWVLEFQHSHLTPEERRSRETFYGRVIWVVDGTRRKRDSATVLAAWHEGTVVVGDADLRRVAPGDSGVLREWAASTALVFFDLGDAAALWALLNSKLTGWAYLRPVPRAQFIGWQRSPESDNARTFDALGVSVVSLIARHETEQRAKPLQWVTIPRRRARRRFRF